MARATFVKKARKDILGTNIKKGDSYYWWAFKFGQGRICSKTAPKRSQLTQSSFLQQIYSIEDRISDVDFDNAEGERDDIVSELESLRDECQDKLDSMPEQLQESSSSGQLLSERIENLETMIDELGNLDFHIDEEKSDDETEEECQERIESEKEEKIDEFRQVSYSGE